VPTLRYVVADVFTDRPLAGNQLAVFTDGRNVDDETMLALARELNFSETTFVFPPENSAHAAKIRIFTPAVELPFAGHPTIGTAWVLLDEGAVPKGQKEFVLEENVGPVPVRAAGAMVWMTHPKLSFGQVLPHKQVAAVLGVEESDIVDDIPAQVASTGNPFLYVVLPQAVRNMVPALIAQLVGLFKTTSLVYAIGVMEFFRSITVTNNAVFAPYELYLVLALGYFLSCFAITRIVRWFDPKYQLLE